MLYQDAVQQIDANNKSPCNAKHGLPCDAKLVNVMWIVLFCYCCFSLVYFIYRIKCYWLKHKKTYYNVLFISYRKHNFMKENLILSSSTVDIHSAFSATTVLLTASSPDVALQTPQISTPVAQNWTAAIFSSCVILKNSSFSL